jgi:DNA-directed RNA polymerase subunit alpha
MLDLALPKIEAERAAENYARFRIEPLEPGYGHTVGNALRRVLLSSIRLGHHQD